MPLLPVMFPDDRGRRVPLIEFGAPAANEDPELAVALARIADRIHEAPSSQRDLLLAAAVPVGAFIGALLLTFKFSILPGWLHWLSLLIGLFTAWVFLTRMKRRRYLDHIVSSLLKIGRCPCCGYNFRGTTIGADGRYLCPECSAAWDSRRVAFGAMRMGELAYSSSLTSAHTPLHLWLRSWLTFAKVPDARYRDVSILPPTLPAIESQVGADLAAMMRSELKQQTRLPRAAGSAAVVLLGSGLFGTQVWGVLKDGMAAITLPLVLFTCFIIVLTVGSSWRIATGRGVGTSKHTAAFLKERGFCPSCGGSLARLPLQSDGCTLCPCCACAWTLPRSASRPEKP